MQTASMLDNILALYYTLYFNKKNATASLIFVLIITTMLSYLITLGCKVIF